MRVALLVVLASTVSAGVSTTVVLLVQPDVAESAREARVVDRQAVRQLKLLHADLAAVRNDIGAVRDEVKAGNVTLWGSNDPHRFDNAGDALDNLATNLYDLCWWSRDTPVEVCQRPGFKASP